MKLVSRSLADQVYDLIKEQILNGTIKCGDRISEESLATQFEVSRTPIREAIRKLSTYGLVEMEPRSHSSVIQISEKEGMDIAALRVNLEEFAIDMITPQSLAQYLEEICRHAADCQYAASVGNKAKSFELDSLFHVTLVKASGNVALADTYERLDAKIQLLRIKQNEPDNKLMDYIMQHAKLIEHIKNGDKEKAKALMREHIIHGV